MIRKLLKKDIHSLYLNNFFRGIAFSLFGIFIPIYLLNLGYSLTSVLAYFLTFHLATFIFIVLGFFLSKKIGYKKVIMFSVPLILIFIILLQALENNGFSIFSIAIIAGIENAFYFLPMHAFFAYISEENKRGSQFSNYLIFGQISGLVGPLVGALVATFFGFKYLFSIVLLFIIISVIPLFILSNIKPIGKIKSLEMYNLIKKHKGFFFGTIVDNIKGEVEGIIWPIFVYLSLKDLISVGFVGFFVTAGTILFTFFLGRFYDKKSKYLFLRMGGIFYALLWFARVLIDSPIFLFASSFFAGFFILMIEMPFTAIFYDKTAKETNYDLFIVFREFPVFIGRAIIWVVAILLIKNLELSFIIAGLATLFFIFLKFELFKEKN